MKNITTHQRQALLLYASTVLGVIIGMLNSVLNTRSLPPESFGDVRYVQNLIAFISSLLLVGFFTSGSRLLALSKAEEDSRKIRGVMCIILGVTVAFTMVVFLSIFLYTKVKDPQSQITRLYLAAIPFCGTNLMLNYVNTTAQGDNHIGRISIARLIPSLLYFFIALVLYRLFGATPERMLLLNNGISFIVLLIVILSTRPLFANLRASFAILKNENKKYGFNVYLGALASVSTSYIAGITLGHFCDNNVNVGFYTLALHLASPVALLPSIIGTTFFKKFSTENRIGKRILCSSIGLTMGTCILFILVIKYVVGILYPESYSNVAIYSSWLVMGTCMHGLGDMFNRFLGAHGQGRQIRNGAFACGIVLITGSLLLVYFFQIKGAVATKICSSFVYLFSMCFYYIKTVKKLEKNDKIA